MIGVIDYGRGNMLSVTNALDSIGEDVTLVTNPDELADCDRIVLPGVGAFPAGMNSLVESGLIEALTENVIQQGKPFLGICLGMQLLSTIGHEMKEVEGLGWIEAEVSHLKPDQPSLKLPHVGWNETAPNPESPLFKNLGKAPIFYYVHSYAVELTGDQKHADRRLERRRSFRHEARGQPGPRRARRRAPCPPCAPWAARCTRAARRPCTARCMPATAAIVITLERAGHRRRRVRLQLDG